MKHTKLNRIKTSEIEITEKVVSVSRVAKVVKGGRRFSFAAVIVVGNGAGIVGYGLGKANEVVDAISKGVDDAKKNLVKIPVLKGTVPHPITGKHDGGFVFIKPAAPGTGVIAGSAMRAVFESAGITDVLAKSKGTSNSHNLVRATFDALIQLRDPATIARQRGITLSQVFHG